MHYVNFAVHANYSALHASALFHSIVSSAIISSIDPTASLKVSIYPLPLTSTQTDIYSSFNIYLVVIFLMLSISVIPASFATHIVREREIKAKHQQVVSGVSFIVYWISNWVWDVFSYLPTLIAFLILLSSFPKFENLNGLDGQLAATILLLFFFGCSITSFTYLLSYLFKTPSGAQVSCIILNFLLGFVLSSIGFFLRISNNPPTPSYRTALRYLFSLFPAFAFSDGMTNLALRSLLSLLELKDSGKYTALDMDITGVSIVFMAWETVVYLLIVILIEYLTLDPSFKAFQMRMTKTIIPPDDYNVRDEDVIAEEQRLLNQDELKESSSVFIKDFKKVYPGGKYAVRGLSIAIPKGECFGLLGINGAGKSTTLSMLSGEFLPTTGEVFLGGIDLFQDIHKCRRKMGFCPQFDSIFDLLTAREHLMLYARIKGILEKDIHKVVSVKIAEMGLTEYADRLAGLYSGGNKRKLSVAIAMIGEPSIVFLDEPSTGMDPVARRFMWRVISDIVNKKENCSVILTTHSMEECEALCSRIGIMVGGVLRCLGSGQRLRSRYGKGFQIEVRLKNPSSEEVSETFSQLLGFLGRTSTSSKSNVDLSLEEVKSIFSQLNKPEWVARLVDRITGDDLWSIFDINDQVPLMTLGFWIIVEKKMDNLFTFFNKSFGTFSLRERQVNKVRIEILLESSDGTKRSLSTMFGLLESGRNELNIEDYSISQTSLEQIFNQFAAQQKEETGSAAGIKK